MLGLALNAADPPRSEDREFPPQQSPLFLLPDGYPVYEVWYVDRARPRWFVMTCAPQESYPSFLARGLVPFHPAVSPAQLRALRDAWRR